MGVLGLFSKIGIWTHYTRTERIRLLYVRGEFTAPLMMWGNMPSRVVFAVAALATRPRSALWPIPRDVSTGR